MDKLEFGIVALETEDGHVYVQPSGWQRFYLLWTFRHFNSLPIQTLNPRQRRLIQQLPRCTSHGSSNYLGHTQLIGTVEGATVPQPQDSSERNFVAATAPSDIVFNEAEAPQKISPAPYSAPFNGILRPASAAILITAVVFMLASLKPWRRFKSVTVPAADSGQMPTQAAQIPVLVTENNAAAIKPVADTTLVSDAQPGVVSAIPVVGQSPFTPEPGPVPVNQTEAVLANPTKSPLVAAAKINRIPVSGNPPVARRSNSILAAPSSGGANLETPRIQFSGPPIHIIYPDSSETFSRGKVTLQALIGPDGKVHEVKTLSGNRLLSAAAARAIRQWRYNPILKDGEPVDAETDISVLFVSADVVSVSFPKASVVPE